MAIEFKPANEIKKSTAVRRDVLRPTEAANAASEADRRPGEVGGRTRALTVSNQVSPVDTLPKPKIGRPRTGYIKAEYNRQYMADLRTIKRLGLDMTVKEFRLTTEGAALATRGYRKSKET